MSNHQFTRPEGTGGKSILGSDDKTPLNQLEKNALGNLDEDKLNDLAKCLFTLNNRRYGPIPGAYMVMCTKPGKEWCVAQLNADRAKPFIIFEDKAFSSIKEAQKEAEKNRKKIFNNYITDGKKNWEKNKSHFKGSYISDDMAICSKLIQED